MRAADELLDIQRGLVERLADTGERSLRAVISETVRPSWKQTFDVQAVRRMPELLYQHVRNATPYVVSAEMTEVVVAAARGLRELDRFEIDSLPSPFGVVKFERPLPVQEMRGHTMLVHGLTWGPAFISNAPSDAGRDPLTIDKSHLRDGILFTLWNDIDVEPDHFSRKSLELFGAGRMRRDIGRWFFVGAEVLPDQMRLGPMEVNVGDRRWSAAANNHLRKTVLDLGGERNVKPFTNTSRYVAALFELLGQTLVVRRCERPSAPVRARAHKARLHAADEVTVVTLRRRSQVADPDHRQVDWSCRWVVGGASGGHWHRYRVGPGRGEVRRRWVMPYLKGPADKPLKTGTIVYNLER